MIQRLIDPAIVELGVHRASEAPVCVVKNSDSQLLKCGERPALLPTVIHHESRAPRERDHANPDHSDAVLSIRNETVRSASFQCRGRTRHHALTYNGPALTGVEPHGTE